MKITAFNGSPKGNASNSHVMVTAFLKGAESAGAEVENIFLVDRCINYCKGCRKCIVLGKGKCVINDDMDDLLAKFVSSDIVVLATPLYLETVSGILKVFMDRTHCLGRSIPPKIVAMASADSPHRSSFQTLSRTIGFFAKRSELIAEIYAVEGPVLTGNLPKDQPKVIKYKELLHKAGQEIVLNKTLSEETQHALENPIIPIEEYLQEIREIAEKLRAQNKGRESSLLI